jgi:hypothetical protein
LMVQIERILDQRGLLTDCDLEIAVEEGVVEMVGTVPSLPRKAEVLRAIRSVQGISGMEGDLHVVRDAQSSQSDSALQDTNDFSESEAQRIIQEDFGIPKGEDGSLE